MRPNFVVFVVCSALIVGRWMVVQGAESIFGVPGYNQG